MRYTDPSGHDVCDEDGICYGKNGKYQAVKTGTPVQYSGFSEDYMKILIVLIAFESYSGRVPDNVNYMKAWALLNLRSFHRTSGLDQYNHLTPFEDWKSVERGVIGSKNEADLLKQYNKYASGKSETITAEEFAEIEAQVRKAAIEWYATGRNSWIDPVKGAIGFIDAPGCYYPNGNPQTDVHLNDIPGYEITIMTDPIEMQSWRDVMAVDVVTSEIYPVDINPNNPEQNVWNFTIFSY